MGQREGARGSAKQSEGQREHTARLASQHQAQGQAVGIQMAMSEAHRRQGEVCVCARGGMAALTSFAAPACDKEQRGTGVQVARAMQWPLARAHSGREGRAHPSCARRREGEEGVGKEGDLVHHCCWTKTISQGPGGGMAVAFL